MRRDHPPSPPPEFVLLILKPNLLTSGCRPQVARSLVGVAGGATRAALIQHQARRDNLADVSAKDASQETLVNLAALLSNLLIVPFLATNNLYNYHL